MLKQIRLSISNKKRSFFVTSLVLIISSTLSLSAFAASTSSASSHIGITKLPTLIVKSMDDAELYKNSTGDHLSTTTCFQAQGEAIPYRISASSLNNAYNFSIGNSNSGEEIPYSVLWSDRMGQQRLSDNGDVSEVTQVNADVGCEMNTLSVKFNNAVYNSVEHGDYTDTLSVMIVIE